MANFIGDHLDKCAKYNPDGCYLIYGDRRCTWKEINLRAKRLASALKAMGIEKGDKVILMFHNCPEFFEANYAIQLVGAIPVPMNYRFTAREIIFQAEHCGAVAYIFEDVWMEAVLAAKPEMKSVKNYILRGKKHRGMKSYEQLMDQYSANSPEVETSVDDICVICYTGGTTGMPKGVMLTYANHVRLLESMVSGILPRLSNIEIPPGIRNKLDAPDWLLSLATSKPVRYLLGRKWLHTALGNLIPNVIGTPLSLRLAAGQEIKAMMPSFPFFHDAAYQLCIIGPITGNMALVCPTSISFNPEEVLQLIEKEKPQLLGNVPTGWKLLLKHPDINDYDLSSVLIAATGAGVAPASLKHKIFDQIDGVIIADIFGQTEMTPATTMRLDLSPATLKDRCIGKPFVETKIVDEQDQEVTPGETGEIVYRGGTVMQGYYNEPDKTQEAIKNGWFHSGDLGYIDEDGDLRILERKNECISSGGEKIFPHEIEEILGTYEGVDEVCVIGVPDETWGSSVRAVIQHKPSVELDEQAIIDWCKDKMAGYKKPKTIIFTEQFPVTAVGKVQRGKVRELYGQPLSNTETITSN